MEELRERMAHDEPNKMKQGPSDIEEAINKEYNKLDGAQQLVIDYLCQ